MIAKKSPPNRKRLDFYGKPKDYRHGFQGQEVIHEVAWEAFDLRFWNASIGRWLSMDPEFQYPSPYVGMGNNPLNIIDPNGAKGDTLFLAAQGNIAAGGRMKVETYFLDGKVFYRNGPMKGQEVPDDAYDYSVGKIRRALSFWSNHGGEDFAQSLEEVSKSAHNHIIINPFSGSNRHGRLSYLAGFSDDRPGHDPVSLIYWSPGKGTMLHDYSIRPPVVSLLGEMLHAFHAIYKPEEYNLYSSVAEDELMGHLQIYDNLEELYINWQTEKIIESLSPVINFTRTPQLGHTGAAVPIDGDVFSSTPYSDKFYRSAINTINNIYLFNPGYHYVKTFIGAGAQKMLDYYGQKFK